MGRYRNSRLFHGTNGNRQISLEQCIYCLKIMKISKKNVSAEKKPKKEPIFDKNGKVTLKRISERREFFLGKSVAKIEHILHKNGYETKRRPSKNSTSHAKIIIITNSNKDRNIQQIQVSPGSRRHGNVPYVKISTSDQGKIKIIGSDKRNYKTDGKENAVLLYRRKRNEKLIK